MHDCQLYLKTYASNYPTHVKAFFCTISEQSELVMGFDATVNYAWAMRGKEFYAWRNEPSNGSDDQDMGDDSYVSPTSYKLNAPGTGLVYTEKLVAFCKISDFSTPAVIVVAPEGNIRFWPSLEEKPVSLNMELDGDLAVEVFYMIIDDIYSFVVTTTSGDFYQIPIVMGKGSKIMTGKISVIKLNVKRGNRLTSRLSKAIFGSEIDTSNYLKATYFRKKEVKCTLDNFLAFQVFKTNIRLYDVVKCEILWELDISSMVAKDFLRHHEGIIEIEDAEDLHLRTEIITTFVDDSGIYFLFGIRLRKSLNSPVYLYLGKVKRPTNVNFHQRITNFEWLAMVNLSSYFMESLTNTNSYHELGLANFSQTGLYIFSKDVIANYKIESKGIQSVSITFNCEIKVTEKCFGYKVIGETLVCFAEMNGPAIVRLLPIGFEVSFVEEKNMDEYLSEILQPKKTKNALYKLLYHGFLNFCQFSQEDPKINLLEDFTTSGTPEDRASTIVTMFENLLNSSPYFNGQERKKHIEKSGKSVKVVKSEGMNEIKRQLEDKLSLSKMFIAFIKNQSLEIDLNFENGKYFRNVVKYMELLQCVLTIFEVTSPETTPFIYEVINMAVNGRNERDQALSVIETFYKFITEAEDIFSTSTTYLYNVMERNENMSSKLLIFLEVVGVIDCMLGQIKAYRSEEWALVIRSSKIKPWTSLPSFMDLLLKINKLMTDIIDEAASRPDIRKSFKKYYISIVEFILDEQANVKEKVSSSLIRGLVTNGFVEAGLTNAEKYHDFQTLIAYTMGLSDNEKKFALKNYKEKFNTEDFEIALYDYYRKNQMIHELLEEKGENVDNYLKSHDQINWMRYAENKEYGKAAKSLRNAAIQKSDLLQKNLLLALGKLALFCESNVNRDLVKEFDDLASIARRELEEVDENEVCME
uniref:Nucleoporin_C domain-containing protein n=1 Tax=Parastrongyloides trichosuri TaxID=131310 RepID=A0A0N4ZFL6_PARTI